MIDRALMILEVLLLMWVVVQGEYVRFYEKEVWRMNKDRFEERKQWRNQKRQQLTRKKEPLEENAAPNAQNSNS